MKTLNRIKLAFTAQKPSTNDAIVIMCCTILPIFVIYILIF